MTVADTIAALDLPPSARVGRRVPKTLLVEHGAPTAADRRRIIEGVEEVHWVATLKPGTVGVPAFRDDVREYLEIAVLIASLRVGARAGRLVELLHRAIPYPVLLLSDDGGSRALSLAHKRWSMGQERSTVLDGEVVAAHVATTEQADVLSEFRNALSLARQPRSDLYELYQGWMDTLIALLAAQVSGRFAILSEAGERCARREALRAHERYSAEVARLRAAAAKERQVPRQVELNLELKRVEAELAAALARL
ncbi:DUF4391 domain-containing protein [Pseudogemmatithrix spongiicola]|uniref:DUF4391 domain-containing protein n=1 Tax=Pseudogemmatithrix spongiicola TaxID=3062599 RepID=A0AA49JVK7_9BACT|nr:DUF4391 domain-containing protein [Gemmatimonadaceae bacterium 'strain 138']WKW15554.1 DUF4391 domain-containing protein [Gemmatimonadaceae bacterium 'strain 318']